MPRVLQRVLLAPHPHDITICPGDNSGIANDTDMVLYELTLFLDPRSSAPTLSEKGHAFLRSLKKKGCKEERVATIGLDDIGNSTTLESNKSVTR